MAKSQTTQVIEHLFKKHWNAMDGALDKTLMSLDDVAQAIRECNKTLSDRNPANFTKDLLRGANASKNWPASVAARRFTGIQRTGSNCQTWCSSVPHAAA